MIGEKIKSYSDFPYKNQKWKMPRKQLKIRPYCSKIPYINAIQIKIESSWSSCMYKDPMSALNFLIKIRSKSLDCLWCFIGQSIMIDTKVNKSYPVSLLHRLCLRLNLQNWTARLLPNLWMKTFICKFYLFISDKLVQTFAIFK